MTARWFTTFLILLVFVPSGHASLRTWDGGGVDNYWMTPANWTTDTLPVPGDDLFFPSGAARLVNSNNFAGGTTFNSIMFSAGGYDLRGLLVTLKAGLTNLAGAGSNIVRAPLSLASNQTYFCNSGNLLLGDIDTAGFTLTFAAAGGIQSTGSVTGTGNLVSSGSVMLSGNNSYFGSTLVSSGTLSVTHSNALGLTSGGTVVSPGATLAVGGPITLAEPLVLAGTLLSLDTDTSVWSGPITITNNAKVDINSSTFTFAISGVISGSGSLSKSSIGFLRLLGTNTYTGPTTNRAGWLLIDGFQPFSDVYALGRLAGTGTVGQVTSLSSDSSGLVIEPGEGHPPLTLNPGRLTTRNLTLVGFDAVYLGVNSPVPGTGHSQLRVLGTINLAGTADLFVVANTAGALSSSITAIDNDSTDPVVGTFRLLPEGKVFAVSDVHAARITYVGGTGNDILITPTNAPPTRFVSIIATNGGVALQATGGIANLQYSVEAATNLSAPVQWTNFAAAYPDGSGRIAFTDPGVATMPKRFYRVVSP
jgi:autotransporter-associated beta strand protein